MSRDAWSIRPTPCPPVADRPPVPDRPSRQTARAWSACVALAAGLTALLAPATATAQAAPESPVVCGAPTPRELHIHVTNEVGAAKETLDVAAREAQAIWQTTGLRFRWTFSPTPLVVSDGLTLVVILRRGSSQSYETGSADVRSRSDANLGWLHFDASERPGNVIQVSFEAIASLVGQGTTQGRRVAMLPDRVRNPLLGRAVGRVVAHEIGHRLGGRRHTPAGLMQSRYGEFELLDAGSPPLPREWADGNAMVWQTTSPRCTLTPTAG